MHLKVLLIALASYFAVAPQNFHFRKDKLSGGYVAVKPDGRNTAFYISSTEITNKQYRDFLIVLRDNKQWEKLRAAMVDSTKWQSFVTNNELYAKTYFNKPQYDNYPVVNISKTGAQLYCEWLTEEYNKNHNRKVEFRLPTEEEWMAAARGGNAKSVYPWEGDSVICQKQGKYYGLDMANYRHHNRLALTINRATGEVDITAPVVSYIKNGYGIYNMSGNVAEFVAEDGFTKGGSWASYKDKLTIASREDFYAKTVANPATGFRPVVVAK